MEIGSEFCTKDYEVGQNRFFDICSYPKRYVLSGRTGLYLIAKELKACVAKIALPDYCCASMIEPFVNQGMEISFYDAFDQDNVDIKQDVGAVLIMDYFGFLSKKTQGLATRCKQQGKTIVVDATQTAFSIAKTYDLADYIVVSYRKWLDCLCATVYSKNGFQTPPSNLENTLYSQIWRSAANLKKDYLLGKDVDKNQFLTTYAKANVELSANYIGYKACDEEIEVLHSVNSTAIRQTRRENAALLMNKVTFLAKKYNVKPMFDEIGDEDCPLFFPILLDENKREIVKGELIKNGVYCPVHWPIDRSLPYSISKCHVQELSLICDQRYGSVEMNYQADVLEKALQLSK